MNTYWYIWYETFEDGKSVGRSRYVCPFSYKSNATRRAKELFNATALVPMTGTTLSFKWVVSQTNPWEEEDYA